MSRDLAAMYARFPAVKRRSRPISALARRARRFFDFVLPGLQQPQAFDSWRTQGLVAPTRDQRPWNTCASFAIAGALEASEKIQHRPAVGVDPGYIHTCLVHGGQVQPPQTDLSAPVDLLVALQAVKAYGFAPDSGQYPFAAASCSAVVNRVPIQGYSPLVSAPAAQAAIATGGPVVAEMAFYRDFFNVRGPGAIYAGRPDGTNPYLHVVQLVGYGPQGWVIQNSFGAGWGDQGFCVVPYGACGIASVAQGGLGALRIFALRA